MNVRIEKMRISDVPFFNEVRNKCAKYLHDQSLYTLDESIQWFTHTSPEFYILLVNDLRIGYFRTSDRTDNSIFIGLDIAEEYRGRGYATESYKKFMGMLEVEGISKFYLRVRGSNKIAFKLYCKLGFVEIGREKIENKIETIIEDDIFMARELRTDVGVSYIIETCYEELLQYNNSTVLITGSNGFIGRWLSNIFKTLIADYGFNTYVVESDVVDGYQSEHVENIADNNFAYVQCDITNINDVENLFFKLVYINNTRPFEYIFNCAGIANPSSYMKSPLKTLDVSYIGTKNIIDLIASKFAIKNIALFSSSEVYGEPEPESIPTNETYTGRIKTNGNRSSYDVGKLVLETLGNIYSKSFPVKIFRPFNLYGPMMDDTRIIPTIINCIRKEIPIKIYGDGLQTRTLCYASDALIMILKLCIPSVKSGFYNIGSQGPEISMKDLADLAKIALKSNIEVQLSDYPADYPNDEPLRRCPDMNKTINMTNYTAVVGTTIGLINTFHNKIK